MRASDLVDHCLELLAPLGAMRAGRMFGGWGLYADGIIVALIIQDRLYLKTDASSRPAFEAAGCGPFVYTAKGREVRIGYWAAPAEAMESAALMAPWARLALHAALAARAAKPALSRRRIAVTQPAGAAASVAGSAAQRAPRTRAAPTAAKKRPGKPPRG